jgi:hypothetical protein
VAIVMAAITTLLDGFTTGPKSLQRRRAGCRRGARSMVDPLSERRHDAPASVVRDSDHRRGCSAVRRLCPSLRRHRQRDTWSLGLAPSRGRHRSQPVGAQPDLHRCPPRRAGRGLALPLGCTSSCTRVRWRCSSTSSWSGTRSRRYAGGSGRPTRDTSGRSRAGSPDRRVAAERLAGQRVSEGERPEGHERSLLLIRGTCGTAATMVRKGVDEGWLDAFNE